MKKTTVIIVLFAVLFTSILLYLYLTFRNQPAIVEKIIPTPTESPDPTANWKTYTDNQYGFSFKYPEDKLTLCPEEELFSLFLKEEIKDTEACSGIIYETPVISFGKYFKDLSKENPFSQWETIVDSVTINIKRYAVGSRFGDYIVDSSLIPLKNGTIEFNGYAPLFSFKQFFDIHSQILSSFKIEKPNDGMGYIEGKIVFPSDGTPDGSIHIKDILSGEIFTYKYTGENPSNSFSIKIKPGTYHIQYKPSWGLSTGYYSQCNSSNNECDSNEIPKLLDITVTANAVTRDIVIDDFNFSQEQEQQLKESFN